EFSRAGRRLREDGRPKLWIDFILAANDFAGGRHLVEVGPRDRADAQHALDDAGIVGRDDLPAGRPIDLHRVVAWRIVAGGDHDAARALLVANRVGEFWRAAVTLQEVNREAGGGHDLRAQSGEVLRAMARV